MVGEQLEKLDPHRERTYMWFGTCIMRDYTGYIGVCIMDYSTWRFKCGGSANLHQRHAHFVESVILIHYFHLLPSLIIDNCYRKIYRRHHVPDHFWGHHGIVKLVSILEATHIFSIGIHKKTFALGNVGISKWYPVNISGRGVAPTQFFDTHKI